MNFLAHSFLSPKNDLILLGNTFGDFVKGKKMLGVNQDLVKGVWLHRFIDDFTDNHPLVKKSILVFKPYFGRFSAIIVDMAFDYFLAKNWNIYSDENFNAYVQNLFVIYEKNRPFLTDRINQVAPVMKMQQWLLKYQTIEGLTEILEQMSRRIGNRILLHQAIPIIVENEAYLRDLFDPFFKELQTASANYNFC